ncbi:MAG: polysaccharide biosynthesis tyrosine autokinase [Verrucomicrobiota bacterium]
METVPTSTDAGFLDESVNLRHYWHVILERRWLVITAFVSILVLCAIYLAKATPIYQAVVRMQIDRESANVLNIKDVFSVDAREQDYLQTQYKNLQSRTLIASVMKKLNLEQDARYAKERDKVLALWKDISIVPLRQSRLVDIKVEHPTAERAQLIANELAKTFKDDNLDQKMRASYDAVTWLKTQAEDQQAKVDRAELELFQYRTNYNEVSLDVGENITRQALFQSQAELSKAQSEAIQAQRVVTEVEKKLKAGTLVDTIPEVSNSPLVQRLKQEIGIQEATLAALQQRYRDKHPEMIRQKELLAKLKENLQRESQNIIDSLRNQADIAKAREDSLEAVVEEKKLRQLELNKLQIKYDSLKRVAENNKLIYNTVLTRMKETELTGRINSNNMRIVDDATLPLKPIKPRIVLTIFLGVFGGLAVALGLAFFVSYLDDSIKSQDDVETYLRLPFLGYVPNIKTNSVIERDLQAHLHPQSNAAEGFRTIRATISLTHKTDKFRILAISSTIPSEGKSLVASNLAIVTAQTGLKTLLVDADLRRPSVHKAFQLHSPTGLSSYLTDEVQSVDELIHSTDVPNLDVVCCGAVPSTPSELIGSKRMMQFLQAIRTRYDRVLLDCPPISAVSDPLIISAMSDGVVFVTKFNKIRREHARKSVQRLQNAGIHIVGVVLNDIDFEGKDSYYYSYYYYQNRYYASHYRKSESKEKGASSKEKGEKLAKT